jgi:hypothetical protein
MLAQGQQSRLKSTRPYMYPCWLVTPRICIVSLPVDHVVACIVSMLNDERMSCSHGPTVCWHFNASRYVVWSVMTLVCVCERACRVPDGAILNVALPPAGVLRNYIVAYSFSAAIAWLWACGRGDVTSCLMPSQPQLAERHKLVRSCLRAHLSRLVVPHILQWINHPFVDYCVVIPMLLK